jgi:hypothetical protein
MESNTGTIHGDFTLSTKVRDGVNGGPVTPALHLAPLFLYGIAGAAAKNRTTRRLRKLNRDSQREL